MKPQITKTRVILLILCILNSIYVFSQGVQALKGITKNLEEFNKNKNDREEKQILLNKIINYYNNIIDDSDYARIKEETKASIKEAQDVIKTPIDNFKKFDREFKEYKIKEENLIVAASSEPMITLNIPQLEARLEGAPVPGSSILVPDVVFSIGPELNTFSGRGIKYGIYSFGISTNLLGAVVGSAFDALGSTALKDYFTENISVGTAIPFSKSGNLTTQLGLGLGGINLNKITIWPILHIEQVDSDDVRLPVGISKLNSDAKNWSSPLISVAILPFSKSEVQDRLEAGKLVFIPVVGLRLPFYYPGSHFSSLGALFTEDRAKYERSGGTQLIISITIPLLRVKPD